VANATFVDNNRTVGVIESTHMAGQRPQPGAPEQQQQQQPQ
jgi:hypothetical protein